MKTYEIISLDIFQTLVDVDKRIPHIWKGILGQSYTEQIAYAGAQTLMSFFPDAYSRASESGSFLTMQQVYRLCADNTVKQLAHNVTAKDIAYNLMYQHAHAPFYDEVTDCLKQLKRDYKIILCSDSNHLMVDDLIKKIDFDEVFISDDLKAYKGDADGRFFSSVLSRTGTPADKIIHIGDSCADVTGAHKAGITSCWLNRGSRPWKHPVRPDYTINDITGLFSIL